MLLGGKKMKKIVIYICNAIPDRLAVIPELGKTIHNFI